jgi:FtsP/CotA-like multicopper oxidase with cupredoxin domain
MTAPTRPPGPSRRALLAGGAALAALPARAQAPAKPAEPEPPTWTAAPRKLPLRPEPAPPAEAWTLGEEAPPTLRVKLGEEVRLRLVNRTGRPLSLHWHGVRNANAMDGVGGLTQPPVAPDATFDYRFTPRDAGTFLVRPMVVGGSAEPGGRGVAGLLVVEERQPPAVDREVSVVLQDWRLGEDGALAPFGEAMAAATVGRLGNQVTVNGRPGPQAVEAAPGARLRLRLANACSARSTRIRFDGLKAYVAAVDGQPTDTFEPLRATLPFPPGTRYDVLLDLPEEPGATGALTALLGQGIPLATFATKGAAAAKRPPIAAIGENGLLPREIKLQNARRAELAIAGGAKLDAKGTPSFDGDPAKAWTINGAAGSAGAAPLFSVKRGTPVVLALTNRTAFTLPMHLHGHVFRLLHNLDDGWEPYWLDTFQLIEGRTARLAFVADNPGRWVIGSAVLDRFDAGLWTTFEVT